ACGRDRALSRAARALPGGRDRVRPGHPARRAHRALDGQRGRRGRDQRRLRRRRARRGHHEPGGHAVSEPIADAPVDDERVDDERTEDQSAEDQPQRAPAADGDAPGADELAFDVHELPGGALAAVEAVLMVTEEAVSAVQLASVLALPTDEVEQIMAELAAEYRGELGGRPRGFELRHVGAGWRPYSAGQLAYLVGRFVLDGQAARLTQAALETLAVIAYRQPVTRGQVSRVRGVNVDSVVRTLRTRGLVQEIGTDPVTGAVRYGTTGYFLERMGL